MSGPNCSASSPGRSARGWRRAGRWRRRWRPRSSPGASVLGREDRESGHATGQIDQLDRGPVPKFRICQWVCPSVLVEFSSRTRRIFRAWCGSRKNMRRSPTRATRAVHETGYDRETQEAGVWDMFATRNGKDGGVRVAAGRREAAEVPRRHRPAGGTGVHRAGGPKAGSPGGPGGRAAPKREWSPRTARWRRCAPPWNYSPRQRYSRKGTTARTATRGGSVVSVVEFQPNEAIAPSSRLRFRRSSRPPTPATGPPCPP